MLLRDDELDGLLVETTAGQRVGRVVGFVVDGESGFVTQYRVRPPGILATLVPSSRELLIAHSQVVSLSTERMVVEGSGTSVRSEARRHRSVPSPQPSVSTVASRTAPRS